MSSAPDKATLTEFSKKAEAEIGQHQFAAKTGGLVSLSAPTFWELFYAAQAWHEHLNRRKTNQSPRRT